MNSSSECFNFKYLPKNLDMDWMNVINSSKGSFSLEFLFFPQKTAFINLHVLPPRRKSKNFSEKSILKQFVSQMGLHPDFYCFKSTDSSILLSLINSNFTLLDNRKFLTGCIIGKSFLKISEGNNSNNNLIDSLFEILTESAEFAIIQVIIEPIVLNKTNQNDDQRFLLSPRILIVESDKIRLEEKINRISLLFSIYGFKVESINPNKPKKIQKMIRYIMNKKIHNPILMNKIEAKIIFNFPQKNFSSHGYSFVEKKSLYNLPGKFDQENFNNIECINIGTPIMSGKTESNELLICGGDISRHMAIFGMTGEGKSRFGYHILKELEQKNRKFLVIDPKGEYIHPVMSFSKNVIYFKPGSRTFPMGINLFSIPLDEENNEIVSMETYISVVCSILEKVIEKTDPKSFSPQMRRLLRDSVQYTIENKGNSFDFLELLKNPHKLNLNNNFIEQTSFAVFNRIERMFKGSNGLCFNVKETSFSLNDLLENNVVIDLSEFESIDDEINRQIFLEVLINLLFYYLRKSRPPFKGRNLPRNIFLIDEVQKLIPASVDYNRNFSHNTLSQSPWTFRSYDASFIFIGTDPSVAKPIITNTAIQIYFYTRYNPLEIAKNLGIQQSYYEKLRNLLKSKPEIPCCLVSNNGNINLVRSKKFEFNEEKIEENFRSLKNAQSQTDLLNKWSTSIIM